MKPSKARNQFEQPSYLSKQPEFIELHCAYMQLITAYLRSKTQDFTCETIQDVENG
jgi:hypothetical protein